MTAKFRVLYAFVLIEHGSRRLIHTNVTENPTADWARQQIREAIPSDHDYQLMVAGHPVSRSIFADHNRIERETKHLSDDERLPVRQTQSLPLLEELRQWLDVHLLLVPPKSTLGKAMYYRDKQGGKLTVYTTDGRLRIDNNFTENAIRPFVIGRNNWLFSTSVAGANASANLYSLVESAKAIGLEPYAYLKMVLTELPTAQSLEDIEPLLPFNQTDSQRMTAGILKIRLQIFYTSLAQCESTIEPIDKMLARIVYLQRDRNSRDPASHKPSPSSGRNAGIWSLSGHDRNTNSNGRLPPKSRAGLSKLREGNGVLPPDKTFSFASSGALGVPHLSLNAGTSLRGMQPAAPSCIGLQSA